MYLYGEVNFCTSVTVPLETKRGFRCIQTLAVLGYFYFRMKSLSVFSYSNIGFFSISLIVNWTCSAREFKRFTVLQVTQSKQLKGYRKLHVVSNSYACSHAVTFHWCSNETFQNGHWSPVTFIFYNCLSAMWVFKCFLSFIHLLLYLKSVTAILFQQIRRYFSISLRTCTCGKIREDSKDLAKLPRHISFVVLESDISFVDLARLIVWSMAVGIPYISVYDREGTLFILLYLNDAIHVII